VLSAGNALAETDYMRRPSQDDYPIEDPAQAWNALTLPRAQEHPAHRQVHRNGVRRDTCAMCAIQITLNTTEDCSFNESGLRSGYPDYADFNRKVLLMLRITMLLTAGLLISMPARADETKSYPFDSFHLALTNGRDKNAVWGMLQLKKGADIVGYIYLTYGELDDPHLSHDKSYVVAFMPISMLGPLLDILRNEKQLQIRFIQIGSAATFYLESQGSAMLDPAQKRFAK
jgi:hypothetical protein